MMRTIMLIILVIIFIAACGADDGPYWSERECSTYQGTVACQWGE